MANLVSRVNDNSFFKISVYILCAMIYLSSGCFESPDSGNLFSSVLKNQCAGGKYVIIFCCENPANLRRNTNNNYIIPHPYDKLYNRKVSSPTRRNDYYYSSGGTKQNEAGSKTVLQTAYGSGGYWGSEMNNNNKYNYNDYGF